MFFGTLQLLFTGLVKQTVLRPSPVSRLKDVQWTSHLSAVTRTKLVLNLVYEFPVQWKQTKLSTYFCFDKSVVTTVYLKILFATSRLIARNCWHCHWANEDWNLGRCEQGQKQTAKDAEVRQGGQCPRDTQQIQDNSKLQHGRPGRWVKPHIQESQEPRNWYWENNTACTMAIASFQVSLELLLALQLC